MCFFWVTDILLCGISIIGHQDMKFTIASLVTIFMISSQYIFDNYPHREIPYNNQYVYSTVPIITMSTCKMNSSLMKDWKRKTHNYKMAHIRI